MENINESFEINPEQLVKELLKIKENDLEMFKNGCVYCEIDDSKHVLDIHHDGYCKIIRLSDF